MRAIALAFVGALSACGGERVAPTTPEPAPSVVAAPSTKRAAAPLARGDVVGAVEQGRVGWLAEDGGRYVAIVTSGASGAGAHAYRLSLSEGASGAAPVVDCALDRVAVKSPPALGIDADRPPAVGATRSFQFRGDTPTTVKAEAIAVGRHAVVWADVDPAHRAEVDTTFAEAFLADFERLILPRARLIFGAESDVDGDGRIALLFTPLTRDKAVAFFSGCDLHPDCPGSNGGEVLYLTPPNAIRPPYNTPRAIKEILAHELEHLLHHHHKVLAHGLREDPDGLYLHEGFGALAQDVTGFQAGNLYVTKAGLAQIDETAVGALLEEGTGYDRARDGPQRGIAYLFTRWIYDRAGGDDVDDMGKISDLGGPTLLRELLAAESSVAAALLQRSDRARLVADFYTTLATPESGARNDCFAFRPTQIDPLTGKQRGADPWARFHGQSMGGATTQTFPGDGSVRAGGGELVVLPPRTGPTTLQLEGPAEAGLSVRVMRVR
ncbi:MAG: hypothetical protein RIF41_27195 [Polyangiaceae bacterium]